MESLRPLKGDLQSFYADELLAVNGTCISDLPFPEGAAVTCTSCRVTTTGD